MNKTQTIHDILTRMVETRNDDNALVIAVWRTEQPNIMKFDSADTFARHFVQRKLTAPESITRIGRLVQQRHPELMPPITQRIDRRCRKYRTR